MDPFYFYIYVLVIVTTTVMFTISRCYFKIYTFDIFFYPNENYNILESKIFLIFHILINFLLGLLFGFNVIYGMFLKIMLFEVYLYFTEYCDIFKTAKFSNLVTVVILSLFSYIIGCIFSKSFNVIISV